MKSLRDWLKRHALDQHYDALVENAIDLEIVAELEEADFAEIGLNLGDRKRMMRAIRTLNQAEQDTAAFAEAAAPFETAPSPEGRGAEKLHLTMIFVDLVGSTSLSNELDLEDYRQVIHSYQLFTMEVIRNQNGYVAQFIGDAVTAYFGYPTAAEDDAERAVFAAMEICDELNKHLSVPGRTMQARVGIATGDLVVEDQSIREGLAFGDTPNRAARIMALAQPGTVAIGERTRRLLGAAVECEWAGEHQLRGLPQPESVWRAVSATDPGLRFRARQKGAVLPIVDREEEMRLLHSRWQSVLAGQTQTVLLSGEAGIGKSRIVEALADLSDHDKCLRLNLQCSEHHQGNAFFPLVSLVNVAANIRRSDSDAQKAGKLNRLLNEWLDGEEAQFARGLFANLLSIPADVIGMDTEFSPEQLKARLQQTLIDLVLGLASRQPVMLLFEDLHWIDPSTEELIDLLITRLSRERVMILCTSRPEYKCRWTGLARVTSLTISRLDERYAQQLMRNALSGEVAPSEMEEEIIAKSDGVPLFLEEMARMVQRRLHQPEGLRDNSTEFALPSTLKDLLRAKLDSLVTAREIVSICAVIGRTIYPSMIEAVVGITFENARTQLDYLSEVEILVPYGNQKDRTYSFRHALIQDAAYDLLLDSRARELHSTVAKVIVDGYPDLAQQQPDLLARHYTRARMPAEARDAWREAAKQAASRSATEETIRHLENALRQNAEIDDETTRVSEEIALRKLFNVALNTRAFGSRPVLENMRRLKELLIGSGAPDADTFYALHIQFGAQLMMGDMPNSLEICDDLDHIATANQNPTMTALTRHNRGMATFMLGRFDAAIGHFNAALEVRPDCAAADILAYHAADIGTVDRAMRCWAQSLQGKDPEPVRAAIETAVAQLDSETHEFTRCYALNILSTCYQPLDDADALLALAEAAAKVSAQHKFQYWDAWNTVMRGWAHARLGEAHLGVTEITAGLDDYLATGSTQISQYARTLLADAHLMAGEKERASATLDDMFARQQEGAISYHLAVAARVAADIRAAQS